MEGAAKISAVPSRLRAKVGQIWMNSPSFAFLGAWELLDLARQLRTVRPAERYLPWGTVTRNDLTRRKSSDTLYVLGSGASVLGLSERDWKRIEASDSIGLNLWLAHPFVPTFYSFESIDLSRSEQATATAAVFKTAMSKRAADYRHVPKLLTDYSIDRVNYLLSLPRSFVNHNTFLTPIRSGVARNPEEVQRLVRVHRNRYPPQEQAIRLLKYRASLVMCIYLGYALGYKQIVLAGIDLSTPDYFYSRFDPYGVIPVGFTSSRKLESHATVLSYQTLQSVVSVVAAVQEELLLPNRVTLSTLNSASPLAEFLPSGH